MKVLVTVKRVLDYNVKPKINAEHTAVDLSSLKMSMNPFCEIAVEEAVRLKEKKIATEIVAVSIGNEKSVDQLRQAMALGVDRAIHIQNHTELNALVVARLLKAIAKKEQPDLILLGKQSIDTDHNQTGQMLAGLLNIGQATFASELQWQQDASDKLQEKPLSGKSLILKVTRETDMGLQTLALKLPAVVTTDLRLNEPRYAKLPDMMKAKKKPITTYTPEDLGITIQQSIKTLAVDYPQKRKAGQILSSVDALLDKLRHEAKVIPLQ